MSHNTRWNMAVCLPLCVAFALLFEVAHTQQFIEVDGLGWERGADATVPFLVDLDGNGLLDLIVGTLYSGLMRYEQIAPHSDEFHRIERDYLAELGIEAAAIVYDIDDDGQLDMLIATREGIAHYVQSEKNGVDFTLVEKTFLDLKEKVYPRLWLGDIDGNSLLDLLVFCSKSSVERYEQLLPKSFDFERKRDLFLPSPTNYQAGTLHDIDGDGLLEMVVGRNDGKILLYRQNAVVRDSFVVIEDSWLGVNGIRFGTPTITDLDGDGLLDMFVGSTGGLIHHYKQKSLYSLDDWELFSSNVLSANDFGKQSSYLVYDLDNDGRLDILRSTNNDGEYNRLPLKHYRQTSIGSLTTELLGEFNGITVTVNDKMAITDLEGDGLLDFFLLSTLSKKMEHYRQRSDGLMTFDLVSDDFLQGVATWGYTPTASFIDLDGNGKSDLLLFFDTGEVSRLEQESPSSSQFVMLEDSWMNFSFTYPFAHILDVDNDGLYEMFVGDRFGNVTQYRQSAVHSTTFESKEYFDLSSVNVRRYSEPTVVDVNNDGKPDIIVGDGMGGLSLFLNDTPSSVHEKNGSAREFRIAQLAPNPATEQTIAFLDLPEPQHLTISVFDVLGRERIRVVDGKLFEAGRQMLRIGVQELPAGYYTLTAVSGSQRSVMPLLKR